MWILQRLQREYRYADQKEFADPATTSLITVQARSPSLLCSRDALEANSLHQKVPVAQETIQYTVFLHDVNYEGEAIAAPWLTTSR